MQPCSQPAMQPGGASLAFEYPGHMASQSPPEPDEEWPKDYALCERLAQRSLLSVRENGGTEEGAGSAARIEVVIHERLRASTREANTRASALNVGRPKGSRLSLVRESKLGEYDVVTTEELVRRRAAVATASILHVADARTQRAQRRQRTATSKNIGATLPNVPGVRLGLNLEPEPEPEPQQHQKWQASESELELRDNVSDDCYDEDGYIHTIYPPPVGAVNFARGDVVYCQVRVGRGSSGWARAVITAVPPADDEDYGSSSSTAPAVYHVRTVKDGDSSPMGSCATEVAIPLSQSNGNGHPTHCERLIAMFPPDEKRVVVAAETNEFRRLIRAHTSPSDAFVVEIGSSFGEATKLIARHCPAVLGLELSAEAVAVARQRYPTIRFEQCDCLVEEARLVTMCAGATKVFIDINGNRPLEQVARVLRTVMQQVKPQLVVVKSRTLHRLAVHGSPGTGRSAARGGSDATIGGYCGPDGVVNQPRRWRATLDVAAEGSRSGRKIQRQMERTAARKDRAARRDTAPR